MLAPISWRVPPRNYGPWETVVSNLTEGLVAKGYDVTLFATGDSITSGKLHWICPRPYSQDASLDPKVWECLHISEVFEHADNFHLIHNHYDFLPLTYSRLVRTPVLTTIHGFSSPRILPAYHKYRDGYYVSISDADRDPRLEYLATVYNGIRLEQFTFREKGGDYLLFLGRIHPDKGVHLAIEVAQRTGRRLIIAGIVQDEDYFDSLVQPRLDGRRIRFIGPVGPSERDNLLGEAYASLHLVTTPERFGLTIVESMACGTPVIGMDLGSVREIIDEESGILVHSVEEAVSAVEEVARVDRQACRRRVEENFTAERMVEDYVKVYHSIMEKEGRA